MRWKIQVAFEMFEICVEECDVFVQVLRETIQTVWQLAVFGMCEIISMWEVSDCNITFSVNLD